MDIYVLENQLSPSKPKSPRQEPSPYLQHVFPPHQPTFGFDPRFTRAPKTARASGNRVLVSAGRDTTRNKYTSYKPRRAYSPRIDMTYVERKALYERRESDYDKKMSQKYTRLNPMNPYKSSMIGAYRQCVLDRKIEMVMAEEDEYKASMQAGRRRKEQISREAERLHEQQMRQTGFLVNH